jgi:hypothetical protein
VPNSGFGLAAHAAKKKTTIAIAAEIVWFFIFPPFSRKCYRESPRAIWRRTVKFVELATAHSAKLRIDYGLRKIQALSAL